MKRKSTTPLPNSRRPRQTETPRATPYVARAAGATLGYMAGGVRGARVGYDTAAAMVPFRARGVDNNILGPNLAATFPYKKMPKNIQNRLVTRTAIKVKGKNKVKKVKIVKVSSSLRAKVKKVLQGQQASGDFTTVKVGLIGSLINTTSGGLNGDDLGVANLLGALIPGANIPSGARTMFGQLYTWGLATASVAVPQTGMTYFTPAKILDAASVLFNNKNPGDPYTNTTGNLTTLNRNDTGAPVLSQSNSLKINIINSYAKFTMKNISNRVVTVEIWECTPKLKFQKSTPLDALYRAHSIYQDGIGGFGDHTVQQIVGLGGSSSADTPFYHDTCHDPMEVAKKYMGYPFVWKKRIMVMAPEETCVHTITGPKGVMDYMKLNNTTAAVAGTDSAIQENFNSMLKGFSVGVVMSVVGDLVLDPTKTNWQGQNVAYFNATQIAMGAPIAVEICEHYKIAVPEVAGFMTTDGLAGTQQMLNMRKPKHIVWNQKPNNGTNTTFTVSNEVNPTADSNATFQPQQQ